MFSVSSDIPAGCCGTGESSCTIFTVAPHVLQNFALSAKGFPHFEQNIIFTPLLPETKAAPAYFPSYFTGTDKKAPHTIR